MADRSTDHPLERLVFFSDAVFAIAITLLVIELHPPELPWTAPDRAHWIALVRLIPNFIGFAVSFAVIGLFWMGHHRAFSLARRFHAKIVGWNLALLGVIAFMPFVTAYLSANFGARVPALLYCLTMLAAALLNLKVNWTATSAPIVDPSADPDAIAYVRVRGISVALGAATSVATSLILPQAGQVGLALIPLWRALLMRFARRRWLAPAAS